MMKNQYDKNNNEQCQKCQVKENYAKFEIADVIFKFISTDSEYCS